VACAATLVAGVTQADLVINEVVDGTLPGGLPKFVELVNTGGSTVDVTGFEVANFNNGGTTPGGGSGTTLTGGPLAAGGYYVVAYESANTAGTTFSSVYGTTPDLHIGPFVNGDDVIGLRDSGTQAMIDVYGVLGVDGTGEVWEYTDGYAHRCGTSAAATFDPSDWIFGGANSLETGSDPEELVLLQTITSPGAANNSGAAAYCTAGTTTNGCNASISGAGFASLSLSSGFTITVTGVEDNKSGIIFFGSNGPSALPWGSGSSVQCALGPVRRTGLQNSGGNTAACDGTLTLDMNDWMTNNPGKAPAAGALINAQAWFRDPGAAKNSNLSNGLAFSVCP
jgi:hypothetical protein